MNDIAKKTINKILDSVEEGSAAHGFVSLISGIVERNDIAAARAELRGFLGEMQFGGERYTGALAEVQTIDALIGFLGRDALIDCLNTTTRILNPHGFSKDGKVSFEKVYATLRLLGHIAKATEENPASADHAALRNEGMITAKAFDLSRLALSSAEKIEASSGIIFLHNALTHITATASSLNEWATQRIHAPDVRRENGQPVILPVAPAKDEPTP